MAPSSAPRYGTFPVCVFFVLAALAAIPLSAAERQVPSKETARAPYIVELEAPPVARYRGGVAGIGATHPGATGQKKLDLASADSVRYADHLRKSQDRTLALLGKALRRDLEAAHRYAVAFHGLALELTPAEAKRAARVPGVRLVQAARQHRPTSDAGPAWTGAPSLWDGSGTGGLPGTKGEGILIGVIDSGIRLSHPSFADVGGDGYNHTNPRGADNYLGWCNPGSPDYDPSLACNDKLIGVWSHAESGGDPADDSGHGTHVASIAAGNAIPNASVGTGVSRAISGVAPHANLVSYDVCYEGYCPSTTVLAAIDQAVADGVDVLNLSIDIGYGSPWNDGMSSALLGAREAGLFVTTPAFDTYSLDGTASSPWLLTVGSATHHRRFVSSLAWMSGGSTTPPANIQGVGLTAAYGPAPIVSASAYGNSYCDSTFPPGTFAGQIVACRHDGWHSAEWKGQNLLAAGAGGMVLVEVYDVFLDSEFNVLPWVYVDAPSSTTLFNWLASGSGHSGQIGASTAELLPDLADRLGASGWGPSDGEPDVLKPDVIAPGEAILAAHVDPAGYKMLSGVSMATAHAAGAAALLIDLHPDWSPAEVQSALQSTALADVVTTMDWNGSRTPASAFAEGSGRLSLSAAARAGLVLDETAAAFEAANPFLGGSPETLNLASLADSLCVVSCGWTRTVRSTLGVTSHWTVSVQTPAGVGLTVVPSSFTLGPGATQVLQITAAGNSSLEGWTLGRVILTESGALAPAAHLPMAANWVPQYAYTVVKGGTGSGRVTSTPAGIDCGSDCSEMFVEDTYVTLTAVADPGSVFVGWDGDCWGGASSTCSDYVWSNQTATAYFNPPYPDKPLINHVARKEVIDGPVEAGTWAWFYADVESGVGELVIDLFDLSGDVQLYVRRGQKPDWSNYACTDWDYYGTNNRRCVITLPAAGRWWVGVNNENTGRIDYSVRASWGTAGDEALANGVPRAGFVSDPQAGGAWKYYSVDIEAGVAQLAVELSGLSADADLYLRYGAKPDRSNFACASTASSTALERCVIAGPPAGRWWVGINNFSAGTVSYTVKADWEVPEGTDFYTLVPCRLLDTRTTQALASGVPRAIQVTGSCGVPATAKAVSVNVTVVSPSGTGHLVLYPGGGFPPLASAINFRAGQVRANNAFLSLGSGGGLEALIAIAGGGSTNLILDVNGYFE